MDCVSCGLEIDPDPVWWAVYAWDAFDGRPLEAMPFHEACFTAGEYVEVTEWQNDENNNPILVNLGMQQRLQRVDGPGNWQRFVDPETEEVTWQLVVLRAGRTAHG